MPLGATGELCTRGYCVMRGYWDDERAHRARRSTPPAGCTAATWRRSTPRATANIVGRVKDMVIRGGENIYPREIEEFLLPPSEDPGRAGASACPIAKYGEEVCAWIILRPGMQSSEEEIREFCRGQIAHYKVPRYVRFVDAFPMTVTGKVQKFVLRQQVAAA